MARTAERYVVELMVFKQQPSVKWTCSIHIVITCTVNLYFLTILTITSIITTIISTTFHKDKTALVFVFQIQEFIWKSQKFTLNTTHSWINVAQLLLLLCRDDLNIEWLSPNLLEMKNKVSILYPSDYYCISLVKVISILSHVSPFHQIKNENIHNINPPPHRSVSRI